MKTLSQILCLALIAFVFAANVYRAAAEPVTTGEASTYNDLIWPPVWHPVTPYGPDSPVLPVLLSRISVKWFGLSEFGLRVPGLAGALLFLFSAWRLARYVLGRGWLCLVALAAVALNPLSLNCWRYGLALGLFSWAVFLLIRYVAEDYDRPVGLLFRTGLALGLSVAVSLAFLAPAAVAGGAFTLAVLLVHDPVRFRDRFWLVVDRFWGPALVPAFLLLVVPLTIQPGAKSIAESRYDAGTKRMVDVLRAPAARSPGRTRASWREPGVRAHAELLSPPIPVELDRAGDPRRPRSRLRLLRTLPAGRLAHREARAPRVIP